MPPTQSRSARRAGRCREPGELAAARLAAPSGGGAGIRSPYPVGSIWAAHQGEAVEPVRHRRAETVLIVQARLEVTRPCAAG